MHIYLHLLKSRINDHYLIQVTNAIEKIARGEAVQEYRLLYTKMKHTPLDIKEANCCPACPKVKSISTNKYRLYCIAPYFIVTIHTMLTFQEKGTLFVSLDGNFGLVSKQNAGTSLEPPNIAHSLFLEQADVDSFVNNYDTASKKGEGVKFSIDLH